jgi:hypothetical protein
MKSREGAEEPRFFSVSLDFVIADFLSNFRSLGSHFHNKAKEKSRCMSPF